MTGRDRDVVDVLVTHGWFAEGGVPNGNDARVSRLLQDRYGLSGLYRNQRASYHVLGEGRTGVVAIWYSRCTAQGRLFVSQVAFQPCSGN